MQINKNTTTSYALQRERDWGMISQRERDWGMISQGIGRGKHSNP